MKKSLTMLLAVLTMSLFAGCSATAPSSSPEASQTPAVSASEPTETQKPAEANTATAVPSQAAAPEAGPEEIRIAALKGPTTIGMLKLIQDAEDKKSRLNYNFTMTTTDEVVPKIVKGEVDIAAVPANLAAVLYNNTKGEIQVLGINTLGVLYLMEKGDTINSVADLKGKTIYTTGKGTTPEYVLNYILTANGLNPGSDVTIEFKSEAAEIIPLLVQNESGIALLPQPFATTALSKVEGLRQVLDMTQEWDKVTKDGSTLVTGVIIGRKEFLDTYPEAVGTFLSEYAESAKYTETNLAETAALAEKFEIVNAAVAEKAIPQCNITFIGGEDMKDKLAGYLTVLFEQNPKSVGGALPNEDFYNSTISPKKQ